MRVVALGQALIHAPVDWPEELRTLTRGADAVICNFEGCLPPPGAVPMKPRTLHAAHPDALAMLRDLGVTHLVLANNHAWDYGHPGMAETRRQARAAGFATAGTGANAAEALAPALGGRRAGKLALIAVDAGPVPPWAAAGAGPGCAALRLQQIITLPADEIARLERLDAAAGLAERRRRRAEIGFDRPEDRTGPFGLRLEAGLEPGERYEPDPGDLSRLTEAVAAAARQADLVAVALHHHVWAADWRQVPGWMTPLWEALRAAGAHALIGTGPPWALPARTEGNALFAPGLGNLVFHTARSSRYDALNLPVWHGQAAVFEDGTWRIVETPALRPTPG